MPPADKQHITGKTKMAMLARFPVWFVILLHPAGGKPPPYNVACFLLLLWLLSVPIGMSNETSEATAI